MAGGLTTREPERSQRESSQGTEPGCWTGIEAGRGRYAVSAKSEPGRQGEETGRDRRLQAGRERERTGKAWRPRLPDQATARQALADQVIHTSYPSHNPGPASLRSDR